jgi:hypothetical protein
MVIYTGSPRCYHDGKLMPGSSSYSGNGPSPDWNLLESIFDALALCVQIPKYKRAFDAANV